MGLSMIDCELLIELAERDTQEPNIVALGDYIIVVAPKNSRFEIYPPEREHLIVIICKQKHICIVSRYALCGKSLYVYYGEKVIAWRFDHDGRAKLFFRGTSLQ